VTCEHCGAALPAFALFCGECGRSVAASPLVAPVVAPVQPPTVPFVAAEPPTPIETTAGTELDVEPPPVDEARETLAPESTLAPAPEPDRGALPVAAPAPAPTPPGPVCTSCGALADPDDRFCGDCGNPLDGATRIIEPLAAPAPTAPPAASIASVPPASSEPLPPPDRPEPATPAAAPADESTRIVPRGTGGARFVLQFSTGESYTVLGSGLAGRNPRPEPGEYVDHLVTIVDPGRSVSKTHFEFGQEGGVFWFSDRHSGNGSVIREPGAPARPCIPGHRYPIVRGTRVDIGEQFVVVS